jgi:hypothetical protein
MHEIDGFYSEHGESGPGLNSLAMIALRKTAITWTCMWWDKPTYDLKPDPDNFFQRHLLMGVYPTAPYPSNNHALNPNPETDKYYLAYGKLLEAMRGKKWVLEPHCIETTTAGVKVNLFEVPGGYVVPVVFGINSNYAIIYIKNIPEIEKMKYEVIQPDVESALKVTSSYKNGVLKLNVPLKNGCAMVQLVK